MMWAGPRRVGSHRHDQGLAPIAPSKVYQRPRTAQTEINLSFIQITVGSADQIAEDWCPWPRGRITDRR